MKLGLSEINPLIKLALHLPLLILVIKFLIPVLIAWLMPGKLLIPSIILLALVICGISRSLLFSSLAGLPGTCPHHGVFLLV